MPVVLYRLDRALPWLIGVFMLLAGALLAACGGGGSSNTPTPPPAITTQPADQSVTAGANAAFSVAATGPSLAYQWQSSPNGTTWSDVAGATSATLTLTALAITDSGKRLRAVVSNSDGSVTSSAALLTVNAAPAQFTALASALAVGRAAHAAALLANGQVLITGGFSAPTIPAPALASAELYNPATNAFAAVAGTMVLARTSHTATTLANGQVLIAGGQYNNNDDGHATVELYNPAAQSFTAVAAAMTSPRGGHAAVLLNDGKVLITGGYNNSSVSLNSAELFDPATQTFTPVAATMTSRRSEHSATLLSDGRVLLAGGGSSNTVYNGAELYDPATQTFTALAAVMSAAREGGAASLLPSGRVLLSGGGTLGANPPASLVALNSADVYDPTSQTFTAAAATMTTRRVVHTQTLLPDGRVLLVGGGNLDANGALVILTSAEIYGP